MLRINHNILLFSAIKQIIARIFFFIFSQNTVHDVYFMKITRKTFVAMLVSEEN